MQNFKSQLNITGMMHSYYVDYYVSHFLLSLKKKGLDSYKKHIIDPDDLKTVFYPTENPLSGISKPKARYSFNPNNVDTIFWPSFDWLEDILNHPVPPFGPFNLPPLFGTSLIHNSATTPSPYKKYMRKVMENSIKSKNIPVEEIENIKEIFSQNEIEVLSQLRNLNYNYYENSRIFEELNQMSDFIFEVSSKENYPALLSIYSIALDSANYWNKNIKDKIWFQNLFGENADKIFAKSGPGGRIGGADVGGAIGGGTAGAIFGASVSVGTATVPGWAAGAIAGGITSSATQAVVELVDWIWS